MTPETLLAALRAHGVETDDVRDGAHEACHALAWDVPIPWTREAISDAAPGNRGEKFMAECVARAVEQLVCEAVGAECGDIPSRALLATMEAMKHDHYTVPGGLSVWVEAITNYLDSTEAKGLTARILALEAP